MNAVPRKLGGLPVRFAPMPVCRSQSVRYVSGSLSRKVRYQRKERDALAQVVPVSSQAQNSDRSAKGRASRDVAMIGGPSCECSN